MNQLQLSRKRGDLGTRPLAQDVYWPAQFATAGNSDKSLVSAY
jgi:hypothetical protein